MAKKILTLIKLQIPAGQANPAPPVGPALGQHGLNIQEFCTAFNNKTKDKMGDIVPVEITVFEDRSFTFITKTPLAAELIKYFPSPMQENYTQHMQQHPLKREIIATQITSCMTKPRTSAIKANLYGAYLSKY